ncbi:MAG: carboxylating nicotinate-nucleotide diphosphorylase [Solirubrobacterales bacterium]|nr:carboxylating nicotinate-nucleotide diphosphorylase [Solirubrobacterales bacterium]
MTAGAVITRDARGTGEIVQKRSGIVFGYEVGVEVFRQCGATRFDALEPEGEWRELVPASLVRVEGSARGLLAAERTALNFLCHLSGVATLTAHYVRAVKGTGVTILDTRKTMPGLRVLEKAAVRAGGGANHRIGLYDGILIKENHAALAGGVGAAVSRARTRQPDREIEIECGDAGQVREAVRAGAERLLLDNMDLDQLREAAAAAREEGGEGVTTEASGGVTLDNVAEVATTGVDFISVGALTHSAPALDLSMLLDAPATGEGALGEGALGEQAELAEPSEPSGSGEPG